jgi:putative flippase GtrA
MILMKFHTAKLTQQMIRFGIIGFLSNSIIYLLYLFFTVMGMGHKTAMTLLFATGALQTFIFNKLWTFDYHGIIRTSFAKYLVIYCFAYVFNLVALFFFVDHLGYEHQIVQGLIIIFTGVVLFTLQRYWVFGASVTTGN